MELKACSAIQDITQRVNSAQNKFLIISASLKALKSLGEMNACASVYGVMCLMGCLSFSVCFNTLASKSFMLVAKRSTKQKRKEEGEKQFLFSLAQRLRS